MYSVADLYVIVTNLYNIVPILYSICTIMYHNCTASVVFYTVPYRTIVLRAVVSLNGISTAYDFCALERVSEDVLKVLREHTSELQIGFASAVCKGRLH